MNHQDQINDIRAKLDALEQSIKNQPVPVIGEEFIMQEDGYSTPTIEEGEKVKIVEIDNTKLPYKVDNGTVTAWCRASAYAPLPKPSNREILERAYDRYISAVVRGGMLGLAERISDLSDSDRTTAFRSALILEACLARYLNEGKEGCWSIRNFDITPVNLLRNSGLPLFATESLAIQARSILSELDGWHQARFEAFK